MFLQNFMTIHPTVVDIYVTYINVNLLVPLEEMSGNPRSHRDSSWHHEGLSIISAKIHLVYLRCSLLDKLNLRSAVKQKLKSNVMAFHLIGEFTSGPQWRTEGH